LHLLACSRLAAGVIDRLRILHLLFPLFIPLDLVKTPTGTPKQDR